MSLDPQTREVIEDVLRSNRVVLFMKGHREQPKCGFSKAAVGALDLLVPDYVTIDVLDHADIREGIKAYGNWPTIPQLYVNGELIGGSDIVLEMMKSGELAEVLGVPAPELTAPRIEIDEATRRAIASAARQRAGQAIHLRIDASWQHVLHPAPLDGAELRVTCGDVELMMDRWTASRADGLRIRMEESLSGTRLQFENPNAPPPVHQMTVQDLKQNLDRGEPLQLIDVRGEDERAIAAIKGAREWNEATDKYLESLPRDTQIVLHCHRGGRSQQTAEYLRGKGFTNLHNLAGGIEAWSQEVDPTVPRY